MPIRTAKRKRSWPPGPPRARPNRAFVKALESSTKTKNRHDPVTMSGIIPESVANLIYEQISQLTQEQLIQQMYEYRKQHGPLHAIFPPQNHENLFAENHFIYIAGQGRHISAF